MTNGIFTEKQIVVGGGLLTYYVTPPVQNSAKLLFLHGWGANSTLWFEAVRTLAKDHQLVFIDLPGFGKSQKPKEVWGLDQYSNCVADFIRKLDLKIVIMLGHSFGGSVAIKLAVKYPQLVSTLVLVDSAGIRPKNVKKSFFRIVSKAVKPVFAPGFMQRIRNQLYRKIGSDYLMLPGMEETYNKVIAEDLTPLLSRIHQHTLLIWGKNDQVTPLTDAEIMKSSIHNSRLEIIPNAGHFSFLDQPQIFSDILAEEVDKL